MTIQEATMYAELYHAYDKLNKCTRYDIIRSELKILGFSEKEINALTCDFIPKKRFKKRRR